MVEKLITELVIANRILAREDVVVTITETGFDELLNPILATADLSFTVLRVDDLSSDQTVAIAAAKYYQGAREVKAVLNNSFGFGGTNACLVMKAI